MESSSPQAEAPRAAEWSESSQWTGRILACGVVLLGAFVLWQYTLAYPPAWPRLWPEPQAAVPWTLAPAKLAGWAASLVFMAVLNGAAWQLGGLVQRFAGEPSEGPGSDLNALARLGHGLLVLPPVVLGLAALHLLYAWLLGLLLLAPAIAALPSLLRAWRTRRRPPGPGGGALDGATRWLFVALALSIAQGPLLAAFGPEVGWDADVYHLAIPERYLFSNAVVLSPFSMFSAFPAAPEMLYLLALALPGEAAAKLIHLELGCLTLALLWSVARRESLRCAALALLFLASGPLFYAEMSGAMTDLFGSFYALFATIAWLDWRRTRSQALLVRAALFAGACLSARYLGGTVLLTLIAVTWLAPGVGAARERLGATLWLGGLASAVLAPWLIRNALFTGNPIAPVLQGIFYERGAEFFSELAIAQTIAFDRAIGMGHDLRAYLALPWNLTFGSTPGLYRNSFGFQISSLPLIAALSGLAVVVWRRRLDMGLLLLQAWLFVTAWFLVFQEARFLLPLAGTLCLLGAWAFDQLLPHARRFAPLLVAVPVLAVAINWLGQLDGVGQRYALALGAQDHDSVKLRDPVRNAAHAMRRLLPPGSKLLLVGASRSYLFRGLDYVPYQALEGPPTLDLLRRAADSDALHCQLAELAVTHVLLNENALERPPPSVEGYGPWSFEADIEKVRKLMRERGRKVHDRHGIRVAHLGPSPACPAAAR